MAESSQPGPGRPGTQTSPGHCGAAVEAAIREQEERWERGECIPVEQLVADRPELAGSAQALLDLLFNEAMLREGQGETPSLSEFQARFPALAGALRAQWRVNEFLASKPLPDRPRPGESPRKFGRYDVLDLLGEGGMGVAYRAWDTSLKRVVALKTLRFHDVGEEGLARFRAEAEAVARVRHPNVVQVFDVGEQDGQPFLTMEFCPGGSLAARLASGPLPPRDAATAVGQIARGVSAAHGVRVVHRDLKPANVLLTGPTVREGTLPETLSDGRAWDGVLKVTDFGLAKRLDAEEGQTRSGAVVGTPSYMAPEQARGGSKQVTAAADIYALGAILYECLTGRPPFKAATLLETLAQVVSEEPVPVRRLQPGTPIDLETIALRCLHKEPDRRYGSAAEVADDLRRYLEGRPVLARPVGAVERLARWGRRNPTVASLLAAVLAALTAGAAGTGWMWWRAERNYTQAQANLKQADENFAEAQANFRQAERNFRATFRAVDESFDKVSQDRLLREPGMIPLRKELMRASIPFYEEFIAQRGNDPSMRLELSHALLRLATISEAMDSPKETLSWLSRAQAQVDLLLAEKPEDVAYLYLAAEVQHGLARGQDRLGNPSEAVRGLTEVMGRLRDLAARPDAPNRPLLLKAEANAGLSLAEAAWRVGRLEQARLVHLRCVQLYEELSRLQPGSRDAQLDRGASRGALGIFLVQQGRLAEAEKELRRAVADLASLAAQPWQKQLIAVRHLAATQGTLGRQYMDRGMVSEAAKEMRASGELWDRLVREHPAVVDYRLYKATNAHNLTVLAFRQGRLDEADAWHHQAMALREGLYKEHPGSPSVLLAMAESYRQEAVLANRRQRTEDVVRANSQAVALLKRLIAADPNNREARQHLTQAAGGQAQALASLGRHAEALPTWDLALALDGGELRDLLQAYRAVSRAAAGDWRSAGDDVQDVLKRGPKTPLVWYHLACADSLRVAALAKDAGLPEAVRTRQQDLGAAEALRSLERARAVNYFTGPGRRRLDNPHLDPLRIRPGFGALLGRD